MSMLQRLINSFQALGRELLLLPRKLLRTLKQAFNRLLHQRLHPQQQSSTQAGFVLPTVVMVILVVTLLTTSILFRSTDRAKNAGNFRVNQVVLSAVSPALDRAKAKLNAAFEDPTLPQGTPSDLAVTNVLSNSRYTLPDEVRLRLAVDFRNGAGQLTPDNTIQATNDRGLEFNETITTAWRFPVDTDNNGRFDSFTLYGIYYRSPSRDNSGLFNRVRVPLDARTPPQDDGASSGACTAALGTSASLVGADGWYKAGGVLKKGFFTYAATVPIVDINQQGLFPTGTNLALYENHQGNRGFAAVEYQQDRARIPLGNNAIAYEDDLDMFSGTPLRINGRIVVNSNLHAGTTRNGNLHFYQVSSDESCFYEAENARIIIGGNITNGLVGSTQTWNTINFDLFRGRGNDPSTANFANAQASSTSSNASVTAYNTQAYEERIQLLVNAAIDRNSFNAPPGTAPNRTVTGNDPEPVRNRVRDLINNEANPRNSDSARREALEVWFRNRTRRVPFAEVPFGQSATTGFTTANVLQGQGTDFLRPPDNWIYPFALNNHTSANAQSRISLRLENVPASDPDLLDEREINLGDRILAGNNLPPNWYDPSTENFADANTQQIYQPATNWLSAGSGTGAPGPRYRKTRVRELVDLGLTDRDGFWETQAATLPENELDGIGGLRIVTGAGVYLPANDNITGADTVVWPDWMPQPRDPQPGRTPAGHPYEGKIFYDPDGNASTANNIAIDDSAARRPYLKMRATAVYHYVRDDDNNARTPAPPVACVSSFYDPTDSTTARNRAGLSGNSGDLGWNQGAAGVPTRTGISGSVANSNNGITYSPPTVNGLTVGSGDAALAYQASLVYPNGRLVNPQLAKALNTPSNQRTLADRAAIDSTLCALQILNGGISPTETPTAGFPLPHGTIQEVSFLDGREIKMIEGNSSSTVFNLGSAGSERNQANTDFTQANNYTHQPENAAQSGLSEYDLSVEFRQPMEIRATAINLDLLRRQSTNSTTEGPQDEWMLPASGIIYATRDDALPDASDKPARSDNTVANKPRIPLNNNPNTPYNESNGVVNLAAYDLAQDRVSPSDFWLDPTRRASAILLINGRELGRNASNQFVESEKGLILATNLPVYIKAQNANGTRGGFNLHDSEEFTTTLDDTWSNFYSRTENTLNPQFACRTNDDRLPGCTTGDRWRTASILSDAVTLLSENFRFGFRNEGDYDLRNNQVDNLFRGQEGQNQLPNFVSSNAATNRLPVTPPTEARRSALSLSAATNTWEDTVEEKRLFNGFWDNTFVTNGLSSYVDAFGVSGGGRYLDTSYSENANPGLYSSYFNNFVTPIQRRGDFPEYLMEICTKTPVSECKAEDWSVNGGSSLIKASNQINVVLSLTGDHKAGTTARFSSAELQKFPRRVAFLRMTEEIQEVIDGGGRLLGANDDPITTLPPVDGLILGASDYPIPLGITGTGTGTIACHTYSGTVKLQESDGSGGFTTVWTCSAATPRVTDNALWFKPSKEANRPNAAPTNNNNQDYTANDRLPYIRNDALTSVRANLLAQPLLEPVLQLHSPSGTQTRLNETDAATPIQTTHWIPRAVDSNGANIPKGTFNLVMATGDSPSRYAVGTQAVEFNGAVSNLPRFLEQWRPATGAAPYPVTIQGSFIQLKRSAYATAPFWQILKENNPNAFAIPNNNNSVFSYAQGYSFNAGRLQSYYPPARLWGFDVGVLSQLPDLFSQRFTLPPTDAPNEYFREVGRNDNWIQTLLCATYNPATPNAPTPTARAVSLQERPRGNRCAELRQ
ncbi:hormogonium polysaccharide biosynthesis protein HpsA [Spirulina subsalsa]|uniref:hormogonium polysaccharide biosynthesis protein HpsA n=1 Tax=Spirulina subsalsa TaxID=54311 RepID=UPI0002D344CF|nr:hormogonium polysaccharide biosynthesis protein HpsA [Spirulina subsalsa]